MASKEQMQQLRSSYSSCNQDPKFIDTFHNLFVSTSVDVQQHFADIPVDRQKKMISYALYLVMLSVDNNPDIVACLENLGDSHDKIEIKPSLYDHWLEALLAAVQRCDNSYTESTGKIWKEVLTPGLEIMKAKYSGSNP